MDHIWQDEYDRVYREALARGRVQVQAEGSERRRHPRIEFNHVTLNVHRQGKSFNILNMSLSGLAFLADEPFKAGERFPISLKDFVSAEVLVVGCELVEADPTFMDYQYRVRCTFTDQDMALVLLSIALNMELEDPGFPSFMIG